MILAMLLAGLRRCEVLGLRMADVRPGDRQLFIAEGKGGHQRVIPVARAILRRAGRLPARRAAGHGADGVVVTRMVIPGEVISCPAARGMHKL
jgi:integrase/recombinase XerD